MNITPGPGGKYWQYKEIFPFIFFSRSLFHLITLFLKGFLLKPAFEKKYQKIFLTNLEKYSNNLRIPHEGFCIINDYERKVNYT